MSWDHAVEPLAELADPGKRIPVADAVAPHQLAGSRLVAQTEPGWYERLPRGDRHVPAYRDREDLPGPSRARLAQLIRQVRLLVLVIGLAQIASAVALAVHTLNLH